MFSILGDITEYTGGVQYTGDIMSTQGVFSTVGDTMSTPGDTMMSVGGYQEYTEGCSVH